jgi:predicted kinase
MTASPTLHLLCGKIASGKSTLATELSSVPDTVVIREDDWLAALYGEELTTIADFVRCSGKLRGIMGPHVVDLLKAGTNVVLDFQANTREARSWMRELVETSGAAHCLHFLDTPDALCKARLRARNQSRAHAFTVTEEQFDQITRHFVEPRAEEGFQIVLHRPPEA